jgi:hypothetical protein
MSTVFGPLAGASAGANPFGGLTQWGFDIPQGDPGELQAAAGRAAAAALSLSLQAQNVEQSARSALSGWHGPAQAAFTAYSGHVNGVLSANGEAIGTAGQALGELARELEQAQQVTRQAAEQCQIAHDRMTTALGEASQYGANAQTLETQAALAAHPQMQGELNRQAAGARDQEAAANRAADAARHDFEAWQRRGRQADEAYTHAAASLSRRISAAADQLRNVQPPAGGAPVPVALAPGDGALARQMLAAAGGLAGGLKAANDPASLERLAGGKLTPGAALLFVQGVRNAAAAEPKPQQGSLVDGIGGFVHTASFGLFSFGNRDTARYRGGELAAMIPVDPDSLLVDADRGIAMAVSDGRQVTEEGGLLKTLVDGHTLEVSPNDAVPLTSGPAEGRVVYRVYGQPADEQGLVPIEGDRYSQPGGHSWSPVSPAHYGDLRDRLGLPDVNGARFVIKGRLTDTTGVLVRHAVPLDGTRGGGLEYLVPDPQGQIEIISVSGLNPPG